MAAARVAEVESDLGRLPHRAGRGRVARDRGARGGARARARDQPPAAADRVRPRADPGARGADRRRAAELETLEVAARAGARRCSPRAAAPRRRPTPSAIARPRRWRPSPRRTRSAHREIEGLEADVEAARSEVFSAINSATALRHALEHAATARDRVAETLSKLDVEADDVRIESERVAAGSRGGRRRPAARAGRDRGDAHRAGGARIRAGQRAHRTRMAGALGPRARAGARRSRGAPRVARGARGGARRYGDAARTVLAQANGKVGQQGAVADYLEVDAGLRARRRSLPRRSAPARRRRTPRARGRRASTWCATTSAGPLRIPDHVGGADRSRRRIRVAAGGVRLRPDDAESLAGLVALSSVVRVNGPFAGAISPGDWRRVDRALRTTAPPAASRLTRAAGRHDRAAMSSAGRTWCRAAAREEARGILETKREIKELRDRIGGERDALPGSPRRPPRSRPRSRRRRTRSPR